MTPTAALLLMLTLVSLVVIAVTLREAFRDGPTRKSPPRSHERDGQFLPPGVSSPS